MKKFTVDSDNKVYLEKPGIHQEFLIYSGDLNIDNGYSALSQNMIQKLFKINYENFGCQKGERVVLNGKVIKL